MVEKSTLSLLILSGFVLAFSFKDLIFIQTSSVENEKQNDPNKPINHEINNAQSKSDDFEHEENSDNFESGHDFASDAPKTIPSLKMKSNVQTLKILYCYSCGYKNAFEQYSQLLKQRFPDLNIIGENYSPGNLKLMITQTLSIIKMVLIGFIISGNSPFTYLNMPTPGVFNWATQNKFYSCLMIFFMSNAIETSLISSGAFEIYLNGMQVWSKLESDRMPHEKELMQILDMNFNFETEKNSVFGSANVKF